MKRFYKLLIIPCMVIIVGLYVIGTNCVLRIDRTDNLRDRAEEVSGREETALPETAEPSAENSEEGRVNINTATREELMTIDGIGEVFSDRIIEMRERVGGFTSVEQLLEIEGISQKKLDRIKDYITVE